MNPCIGCAESRHRDQWIDECYEQRAITLPSTSLYFVYLAHAMVGPCLSSLPCHRHPRLSPFSLPLRAELAVVVLVLEESSSRLLLARAHRFYPY